MRRGRWTYQPEHQAWQLNGSGWYLKVRTGVTNVFRGCSYCWHLGDDRRWVLYGKDPGVWVTEPPRWWGRLPGNDYGSCSHRRYLNDAMPAAEEAIQKAFGEHVLKTLATM